MLEKGVIKNPDRKKKKDTRTICHIYGGAVLTLVLSYGVKGASIAFFMPQPKNILLYYLSHMNLFLKVKYGLICLIC